MSLLKKKDKSEKDKKKDASSSPATGRNNSPVGDVVVERLDLSKKSMEAYHEAVREGKLGTHLRNLHMNEMGFTDFPSEIQSCVNLVCLEMNQNRLRAFPNTFKKFKCLETLSFMGNAITTIPPEVGLLRAIETLNLQINWLQTLPQEFFQLVTLKNLDISANLLEELPKGFARLTNLERLNARANQITTVTSELSKLPKLQVLNLSDNLIEQLELQGFMSMTKLSAKKNNLKKMELGSCPNLVDLDLSYNELESIPTFELPALKNLQLQHNKLASMTTSSRWMSVSSNIETLNLQSNKIEAVPDELFKCVKITSLDLSHNRLKTLQEAIGKLSSLTFLDLSRNQLTSLPSQVGDLSKLTSLIANYNSLTEVPKELSNLTGLKTLELGHNPKLSKDLDSLVLPQLTSFRGFATSGTAFKFLSNSPNLTKVYLGYCDNYDIRLGGAPYSIKDLSKLSELHLAGCGIKALPKEFFSLFALKKLWLNNNQIQSLPNEISNLQSLDLLDLSHNKLEHLPESLFQLRNIEELYLSHNGMYSLPQGIEKMINLSILDLSYNPLGSLPSGIGSLPKIQQLNVIGCVLSSFTNELNKTPILVINASTNASLTNVPDEWKNVTQGIIQSPNSAISDLSSLYSKVVGYAAYLNARRKSMEDNFVIQHELPDMPSSTHVFAVFDGHAGPEAAAHCCIRTVPLIMKHAISEDDPKSIETMMHETMTALAKFSTSETNPLTGATANLAVVIGEELYLATCGDVQTAIIENDKIAYVSPTQTPDQSSERLRIQRLGGWVTEQGRVNGAINVSRCLGSIKYTPYVSNRFELVHRKISDDTSAMIMASDGLWSVLTPEEVLEVIRQTRKSTGSLKTAAIILRDYAFQLGSADNITVLVVDFKCDD